MLLMLSLNMGCIDDQHARQQFKELAMQSGVNLAKGAPGTTVQQYLRWRQALVVTFTPDTYMGEIDRALTSIQMLEHRSISLNF